MKRNLKLFITVLGIMLLLAPVFVKAQTTGTLRGFVTDDNNEPLPGVTIEITSDALMTPRAAVTDARGSYRFLYLPPGKYVICAKLEGFETCWLRGVPVQVQQVSTADVTMDPGTLEETIEVTAAAPLIDTESSSKTYNVNLEMLTTIPIAPRMNFSDVWQTLPGVSGGWGQSPLVNAGHITRNLEPGKSYFWSHHNQDDSYENKIKIDGMEINDSMSGTSYAQLNYEAVQEIDIKTAGASAEYGNARSAFMNVVTKSGGNEFQGSFLFLFQIQVVIILALLPELDLALPIVTTSARPAQLPRDHLAQPLVVNQIPLGLLLPLRKYESLLQLLFFPLPLFLLQGYLFRNYLMRI